MRAIDPAGAQDQVWYADGLDCLFASPLAAAVDVDGAGRIGFDVGTIFRTVEHVVGAVMDHRGAQLFRLFRHHARCFAVDAQRQCRLALGLVDSGVGGRIDDQNRLDAANHVAHLVQVGRKR